MKNVELSRQAEKFLLQLDDKMRSRIIEGLQGLREHPQRGDIKKMKGKNKVFRLRVGIFRAEFSNMPEYVYISKIETRERSYR